VKSSCRHRLFSTFRRYFIFMIKIKTRRIKDIVNSYYQQKQSEILRTFYSISTTHENMSVNWVTLKTKPRELTSDRRNAELILKSSCAPLEQIDTSITSIAGLSDTHTHARTHERTHTHTHTVSPSVGLIAFSDAQNSSCNKLKHFTATVDSFYRPPST